jgi:hypothetical protein
VTPAGVTGARRFPVDGSSADLTAGVVPPARPSRGGGPAGQGTWGPGIARLQHLTRSSGDQALADPEPPVRRLDREAQQTARWARLPEQAIGVEADATDRAGRRAMRTGRTSLRTALERAQPPLWT